MNVTPAVYEKYSPVFRAMAAKFTNDEGLQEDCVNEAWMALMKIPVTQQMTNPSAYLRGAARFAMLSYLESYNTGDWYVGRKGRIARFSRIDHAKDAVQIDTAFNMYPGENVRRRGRFITRDTAGGGARVAMTVWPNWHRPQA